MNVFLHRLHKCVIKIKLKVILKQLKEKDEPFSEFSVC